tara:strand:+ start:33569 stop:34216 length:648 start_codon:yes stop_codon:yes gene_type:complete
MLLIWAYIFDEDSAGVTEFSIRDGQLSDCHVLARLINESSKGAADYLFNQKDNHGKNAEEMVSELLAREVHYSYANSIVVQFEGNVVGMALSFPSSGLMLSEQIKQHYSERQFQYVKYFAENTIADSWHLDAICIDAEYRGNGIGRDLLQKVKQQASYYKYPELEVFVFANNTGAIRFYQRHGFAECKEIDVSGHEFLNDKSPLLLMRCQLPGYD